MKKGVSLWKIEKNIHRLKSHGDKFYFSFCGDKPYSFFAKSVEKSSTIYLVFMVKN